MKIKRKPPGRPWHKPVTSSKVCLICLRRYQESLVITIDSSSDEEGEDDCDDNHKIGTNLLKDPLADDDTLLSEDPLGDKAAAAQKTEKVKKVVPIPKKRKLNLYLKFLSFLSRHLQIKTKRFRHAATKNELSPPFCDQCRNIVKRLCDIYEELNNAKLELQWRLMQIRDTIKCSKMKVSGKMGMSLVKSLSTQLRVSSSNVVDTLRKQVSVKSTIKSTCLTPKVSIHRDSCLHAMAHKLKYPMDQIKQYMVSLIVIFTLALPPVKVEKKKSLPLTVDKHRSSIVKKNGSPVKVKKDTKVESKKENVPPNVKMEPGGVKGEEISEGAGADDDLGGGDYSPPNSGPNSPANNSDDNDEGVVKEKNNDEDEEQKNSDSDWSMKGRGDESGSDVEFHPVRPETERRWNLRKRRTRASKADSNGDESDEDFTPGVLPPLRAPKGSKAQRILYDDSEKQFKCNMCNKRFRMERTLKRHLGEVHSLFLQHKCPHCDLKFRKQTDLKIHKRKAHLPANFKMGDQLPYKGIVTPCTVCQKVFPSRIKMTKHRKTHNLMESHTCEICGKTVVGLFRIQFHMKTHNRPDKPFHCKKCPRSFATQDGLDMHLKLHDNPDWVPWVRKKPKKTNPSSRPDGPYKCEEPNCGKSFVKPYNLQVHMALHATNFSCAVCEQVFEKVRDIRRHLNKLHETENKVHFCVHCDKAYTIEQSFDIHKKVAHPSKGKIPCDEDYCTEEFDDADLLREHLKTHLVGGESQATSTENADDKTDVAAASSNSDPLPTTGNLNIETSEENLTNEELELIKPGIYTCERCNWSFCKKLSLTLHKLVHTPKNAKKLYPCVLCEGKAFAMVDSLQTHYNRLHGPKLKPYLCLQCGVRFHRKESFTLHGQTHIDRASSSSFECETCQKKFRDSVALKRHIRLTHETGQKCDQCDEKFAGKLPLMYHKHEKHGMEKPVKCEVEGCGKGFFNQYQLSMHRTCHNDGKFNCPMCPKVFRRSHNLADHILVHKQEKNHICHFCGKAFVKKSSLNIHLVIHTQDKQFKCPHCPKAFCRKFTRDCHIRTHTKETPFTCHICGRQFGQYTSMRNHLKVHMKLNSTEVVRRPFKKTIGVGKPLVEKSEEPAENSIAATEEVQDNSEPKFEVPTASGIIHEALQAAFQDINMDLESSITVKDDDVASAAPIVEDQEPANDAESEESEVEAPVVKRKRGRPRKSKDFICGICGKAFVREKPYNAHVERHLNDAGQSNTKAVEPAQIPDSRHVNISMPELTPSPAQILSASHSNTHQNTAVSQAPNLHPAYVPPQYPVASTTTTRKSSRKVPNNKAPGSRLARIVEDVIEAATNKSGSAYTNVVTSSPTNVIQNHYHQEPNHHQHHNLQQSHHIQSPPPPHHLSQPNSERSTPTGSNHNTPSPVPTTTIPTSTVFPSTSFLSPFLYANPYLLPLQPQQQGEQQQLGSDTSFQGQAFPGYTNAVQNRQQPQQQQFQYQHNQVQYQQNASHGSPNTMPQDLSKTSYSVFYANPR